MANSDPHLIFNDIGGLRLRLTRPYDVFSCSY